MTDEIPEFSTDEDLEALLTTSVSDLDEATRIEVQRYKARKLKAKRDAGLSSDRPGWWGPDQAAPQRADGSGGRSTGTAAVTDEDRTTDPEEAQQTPDESDEAAVESEDGVEPEEPGEMDEETEDEERLPREELSEEPGEEELMQAELIEQPVEQDDSEGIFFTTVDSRKVYLAYGSNAHFLTLYYYQIPTSLNDPELEQWIRDLLATEAFEYALDNNLTVIPKRADVSETFLDRHPEYRNAIKISNRRRRHAPVA